MITWVTNCATGSEDKYFDLVRRVFSAGTEVGPPKASALFTAEELAATGMVGIYKINEE